MTTKLKISLGFLLMLLIILLLSLIAYNSTIKGEIGLKQNVFYSNINVDMSDTIAAIYRSAYHRYRYVETFDKANIADTMESLNKIKNFIKKNLPLMVSQEHKRFLNNITSGLNTWEINFKTFYSDLDKFFELYEKKYLPEENKVAKALEQTVQKAWEENNTPALYYLLSISNSFQSASMYINIFSHTFKNENFDEAIKEVKKIEDNLLKLKNAIASTAIQNSYSKLVDSISAFKAQVEMMKNNNFRIDEANNVLIDSRKAISDNASKVNSIYDSLMDSFNIQGLENNGKLKSQIMIISAIGFLAGIICTIFITASLARVLSKLSSYATAISRGNFKHNPDVLEKGDIGKMVDAIHQIPTIFENLISKSNNIAYSISSGTFRGELPEKEFYGEFSTMATSINSISKSFVKVIDALPTGIITANKDHAVLFMNDVARKTFGNLESTKNLNDIDRDLTQAIHTSSIVKDETSIVNNGTTIDLSISAMPLSDIKGNVVGGMEIVTDITEIKEKQKTMLYVAAQASEIADRVAAASEELAAQMEQISNGATIQRTRIESTASAMTEMNSTVIEVAQSAALASEQSEQTRISAESGADLVNNVVSSIDAVNTISNHLQSNMHELGSQADNIGGVMNVISDIADQTNLLALNAAIEAARAGEAGRGFAVVADEVRKLAEKTMTATSEVGNNISAIQQSARTNIESMNKAASNVQEATELANSSGKALEHILEIASKTSSFVTSIATAAEEQSATSEEITHSVEEVNRVISETTEGISQSSLAVQELSTMAQELKSVMEHLK